MIRALVVVFSLGSVTARAETVVELPKTKVQLVVDDTWTRVANKDVVVFKHTSGTLLAVTRADVPNPDAWIVEKKQAYADAVERGIKASVRGYKRTAKKLADVNGVPALDVEAKRDGGAMVVMRVLLFRTYALSLAIEVPKGGDLAIARALVKAFVPPKEPPVVAPAASH